MDLGKGKERYFQFFHETWRAGETFLNIEQDIEIHAAVIPSMEKCPEPWCLYPYSGAISPGPPISNFLLKKSLGCTRFSAELLTAHPHLLDDVPSRDWQRLDAEVFPRLDWLGYTPHFHWPYVLHHHVYNGVCSCEYEHEEFPVDREGRYKPSND